MYGLTCSLYHPRGEPCHMNQCVSFCAQCVYDLFGEGSNNASVTVSYFTVSIKVYIVATLFHGVHCNGKHVTVCFGSPNTPLSETHFWISPLFELFGIWKKCKHLKWKSTKVSTDIDPYITPIFSPQRTRPYNILCESMCLFYCCKYLHDLYDNGKRHSRVKTTLLRCNKTENGFYYAGCKGKLVTTLEVHINHRYILTCH